MTRCTCCSIAAALAVRKVCTRILELYRTRSIFSMVLSDRLAVDACNRFAVPAARCSLSPASSEPLRAFALCVSLTVVLTLTPARPMK
ncbi:hypothetical protein HPB49_012722 [Dermacentor silvarum]|uniref:Uncharacterized protein n=1 Tax=Dermacentor silvarum TaxID=543639 RepID=A0ACB8C9F6_DERSI|nr:hypothetical protein HPB49_012722 [Dermacentor silvarum]